MNYTQGIVEQMKPFKSFGEALNFIQESAERNLSKKRFKEYLKKATNDFAKCESQDGILINDRYFDWKEFERKKNEIIEAYCEYFTEEELKKLYDFQEALKKLFNGDLKALNWHKEV